MQNDSKFEQKLVLTIEPDFSLVKEEKLVYAGLWDYDHYKTTI
jgi:hypothetical protein